MYHEIELNSPIRFHKIMGYVTLIHLLLLTGLAFYEKPQSSVDITQRVASHFHPPSQTTAVNLRLKSQPPSPNDLNTAAVRFSDTPRSIKTISTATASTMDAAYLNQWQHYVEAFGNQHYPQTLLRHNLSGKLRLLVCISKDGALQTVSIRQSSGIALLDNAAIDIVKASAPFEPIPDQMLADEQYLEILRTWEFSGKLSTSA